MDSRCRFYIYTKAKVYTLTVDYYTEYMLCGRVCRRRRRRAYYNLLCFYFGFVLSREDHTI